MILPFAPRSKAALMSFAKSTKPAFLIKLTEKSNDLQRRKFI